MRWPIRFERRLERSRWVELGVLLLSLVLAGAAGALVFALVGVDPRVAYKEMFKGAFGGAYEFFETLLKAIPLMLCGLGVALAFRMLFWNIGAEGQLAMGAFAAAGVALFAGDWIPRPLALPVMIAAGFLAGAIWVAIPALFRLWCGANEILTTLMLNYIATLWVEYLFYGPWKDPKGYGFPGSAQIPQTFWLPRLAGTRVHGGIVLAVVVALLLWAALAWTRWGYEIRVIGENPRAARYAGINVGRNMLLVACLSGGLAGLAGMAEVAGVVHRLQKGLTVGYGYTAILVAWLADLHPLGVLVAAVAMAALLVGGDRVQIALQLPASIALVLQGVFFFLVLVGQFFVSHRVRWVGFRRRRVCVGGMRDG